MSRTASNVYWMSRYMERAENTARIVNIVHHMSLLPKSVSEENSEWSLPLKITDTLDMFFDRHHSINPSEVLDYITMDENNPSSIYSSILAARENGRAVRGKITTEMWESLNATWLELKRIREKRSKDFDCGRFFEWVKERSHLFRGVTHGTILHDATFHFVRLGTFVERADSTARILDVKYHVLLPSLGDVGGAVDYYQWGALLRSVSAFESYRRVYRDVINPFRVAEMLVLREDMPRSLHACLDEIQTILGAIGGFSGVEARRRAGELHAGLHFARMTNIFKFGLHEFLTDFLSRITDLAEEIHSSFFVYGEGTASVPEQAGAGVQG
ncbi:MAG: alpha-E domain-containing protein [Leptospirales bacterium]